MRPLAFFRFLKVVLDIDTRLEEKTAKPGGPWRNRWWCSHEFMWAADGNMYGPGEFLGVKLWPTKDIAETYALEWLPALQEDFRSYGVELKYVRAELA